MEERNRREEEEKLSRSEEEEIEKNASEHDRRYRSSGKSEA